MLGFLMGALSSIVATFVVFLLRSWIWPSLKDKCFYEGVRVAGEWDVYEVRNGKDVHSGRIKIQQLGCVIKGESTRTKTRDGRNSERKFHYSGLIRGHQITLTFEDAKGKGFDTGSYIFIVQNDSKSMVGMTTFHGKYENKIVAEGRVLKKVIT